ncbi:MAG TPA: energy transducer TonB [Anaeromyxobacteraceae bacterium]|nr:energy transducer TonB [Anaeromyxobacteraceae bacterium]
MFRMQVAVVVTALAACATAPKVPAVGVAGEPARARDWIELLVPGVVRPALALDASGLAEHPLTSNADVAIIDPLVQERKPEVNRCLPVRVIKAGAKSIRDGKEGWASFLVDAAGEPADIRVETAKEDAECVRSAIAGWRFPSPKEPDRRVWIPMEGTGRELAVERPAEEFAVTGYVRPREAVRGCVASSVRIPPYLAGLTMRATVKFAVLRDGSVSRFRVLEAPIAQLDAGLAVKRAVERCEWVPGKDPSGAPAAIWVVLPLRFQGGPIAPQP